MLNSLHRAHTIRKLLEPQQRPWKNFARYYIRKRYGKELAQDGTRMLTANYSWAKIATMPAGTITEKMRQAFIHAGKMPKLHAAGTSQMRAPPKEHRILYYVERHRDSVMEGIQAPREPKRSPPPTTAERVRKALLATGSPWAIELTTDKRVATIQAQQQMQGGKHSSNPTGKIIAIRVDKATGFTIDVSDKGGQARAGLTGAHAIAATERRSIILHGTAAQQPNIPADAMIGSIEVRAMHTSGLAEGTPHNIRLKAIHPITMQELERFEACMQQKAATQMASEGVNVTTERAIRSEDAWTRSRVERQLLLHNPFLGDGSRLSERSDEATEAMAIKWAINGLATVQDALNDTGDDLMTTDSFRKR